MNRKIYRAKELTKIESYPVAIFDGTGSMAHEYESAVAAYYEVFSNARRGMKEFQYQFQHQVYDLLPYQGTSGGNISQTFLTVLRALINNRHQLPKCLTIIFMSDGEEHFRLEDLTNLIEEIKTYFSISFISVAVGKHFPNQISNNLRNQLHNQDPKIQPLFVVNRDYRPKNLIQQEFKEIFMKIKEFSYLQEGKVQINQMVQQTIVSKESEFVIPGSVFYVKNQEKQVEIDGKSLLPTFDEEDIVELMKSSVSEGVIISAASNDEQIFKVIQTEASNIIENIPIIQREEEKPVNNKIQEILEFVDNIAEGNLSLTQLTNDQKTNLQEALVSDTKSLKDEVIKYVDTVKNGKNLTQKNFQSRISEKYKQIKVGCYVKGKKMQQLSQLEQTEIVMKETLKNSLQVIENDKQCDITELLSEFKNQTFISLNKVFKDSGFKVETEEQIQQLKKMNDLFQLIHKVTLKQVNPKDFIDQVKAFLDQQQQQPEQNIKTSIAMFDSNEDFNHLPAELKLLVKEGLDLEDAEKVIVLVVDQNVSMEKESNVAIEKFQQLFEDVQIDKKAIISWQNNTFKFINQQMQNQQQQINSFNTLYQCLQSIENDLQLKNRRLQICLVTDGETDYKSMHSQLKVIKFHYSVQMIYFTIGRTLFAKIEDEIKKKYADKNVKGAPELINIPRSLNTSVGNNQKLGDQFSQKFEILVKKFKG